MNTLCFLFLALKSSFALYQQTFQIQSHLSENVIVPCNGSGFPTDEIDVHWESMGNNVITVHNGLTKAGEGFESRVKFLSDPSNFGHDYSFMLSDVKLHDEGIYECLMGGRSICFVHLQVKKPDLSTKRYDASEGEIVTLECFGNLPKSKAWEDIYVTWFKDGREILHLSSGKIDANTEHITLPPINLVRQGIFSLTIKQVEASDQGFYECQYKSTDYEQPRTGFPEQLELTVRASVQLFSEADETSHTHNPTIVPTLVAVANTQTHATSAGRIDVLWQPNDEPLEVERIPWIRICLISGVLLVTAVVLGSLRLCGRI